MVILINAENYLINSNIYSWVGKICWRRARLPTPVFWSGEFHRLYSPWGRKESDMTDRLSFFTFTFKGYKLLHIK